MDIENIIGKYKFIKRNIHKEFDYSDNIYTIIFLEDLDLYLSINGYYDSWEDNSYEGSEWEQVWPKEKVYKYTDYLNFEDLQKD